MIIVYIYKGFFTKVGVRPYSEPIVCIICFALINRLSSSFMIDSVCRFSRFDRISVIPVISWHWLYPLWFNTLPVSICTNRILPLCLKCNPLPPSKEVILIIQLLALLYY